MTVFEVENAGCPSCAETVRAALSPLGHVEDVLIDEAQDLATVHMVATDVNERAVADALAVASTGAGHAYRVKPGSWRVQTA